MCCQRIKKRTEKMTRVFSHLALVVKTRKIAQRQRVSLHGVSLRQPPPAQGTQANHRSAGVGTVVKSAHGCALGAWLLQVAVGVGTAHTELWATAPHAKCQRALGGCLGAGRFKPRNPCHRALRMRFNHSANSTASVSQRGNLRK